MIRDDFKYQSGNIFRVCYNVLSYKNGLTGKEREKEIAMYPLKKSGAVNWKTNLAAVWLSQLLSLSAFYFCLPFLPLYLKEKNIVPHDEIAFWSGIFIAAAPISMMVMSPIWGMLGDKYGRKMMLVRANLAGAFVLYLMATVNNMEALIVLRLLQGAFTGTVPSAQSLIAAGTPEKRQGFALGLLMAAMNAAYTAGAYFGGVWAESYGAESTFRFAGYMLVLATLLVVAVVREDFTPPPIISQTRSARLRRRKEGLRDFKSTIPAMLVIAFIALLMTYDGPFLPLYVEQLHGGSQAPVGEISGEVYRLTGSINALASIIAIGGSILISYLMDRNIPAILWGVIALAGSMGIWFICWFESIPGLMLGRSTFLFFMSGLASVLVVLLSRLTPPHKKGSAMGWTVTARCIGWTLAPLVGGWLVQRSSFHDAYWYLAVISLVLIPAFALLSTHYPKAFGRSESDPDEEDPAVTVPNIHLPPQTFPITPRQSARFHTEEE